MRSRAGCQILSQANFSKALNMKGGITSWNGSHAVGSETQGLAYFTSGEYTSTVAMAYAMEKGLKKFYSLMADKAEAKENAELLTYMAKLEDGHMAKLSSKYADVDLEKETAREDVTEGGFDIDHFAEQFKEQLDDIESIIQTGMMFEAQAFDLYTRLSRQADDETQQQFYVSMAKEEQQHLKKLAQELDKRLP